MKNVVEIVAKELAQEILEALPANAKTGAKAHPQHDGTIKMAIRINGFHHVFHLVMGMNFNRWGQAQEASETAGIVKHHMRKQRTDNSMTFDLLQDDSIDKIKTWIMDVVKRES